MVEALFFVSLIPAVLNLIKNLLLNKKFKAEVFKKKKMNRHNHLLETTWQGFTRSYRKSFKRRNYNRTARKDRSRSLKIKETVAQIA